MNIWRDMDADPPDDSFLGRQIIVSVIPRYGPEYTTVIRWYGVENYVESSWPIITHWQPLPKPYNNKNDNIERRTIMKNLYIWMNNHMKIVAICWIICPMLSAVIPGLTAPAAVLIFLASLFFELGDYVTGWWDELPVAKGEE